MEEPRKIVLVLGNGFDLDLGLKTSYKDFWVSDNCPKIYPAPIIHYLNGHWGEAIDSVRWYDLENELLNYYLTIKSKSNYDIITEEERSFLRIVKPEFWQYGIYYDKKYLQAAYSLNDKGYLTFEDNQKNINIPYLQDMLRPPEWRDKNAINLIKKGLCDYLISIENHTNSKLSVASAVFYTISKAVEEDNVVDIFTFNYTKYPYEWDPKRQDYVHYVHGDCSSGVIIIGTKDYSDYNKDYDFFQKSFDPEYDPPDLVSALNEADDIIIFGHSLGENDCQYFKSFFRHQSDNNSISKHITIFTLNDDSEMDIKRSLQKMTDNNLAVLFNKNRVHIFKTANIQDESSKFKAFLSRYTSDKNDINDTMSRLGR